MAIRGIIIAIVFVAAVIVKGLYQQEKQFSLYFVQFLSFYFGKFDMNNIYWHGTEAYSYKQNSFKEVLFISDFKILE